MFQSVCIKGRYLPFFFLNGGCWEFVMAKGEFYQLFRIVEVRYQCER